MYVNGIGTAVPPNRYLKSDCWEAFQASDWFQRLGPRAHAVAKAVLLRDNGIEARHLALDSLEEVFQIDPDTLDRRFIAHAPALARDAGMRALEQAGLQAERIDAIVVSTCTGYLCPGLSGYVAERLGLRPDIQAFDLVGQGCAAALPNMRLASALLDSAQCSHVLSVCVEVCSAAMYLDDDPGVLISACLFGDGAGAAVLSRRPRETVRRIEWRDSESLLNPTKREALMFEQRSGMLRNILTRDVPWLAAEHAHDVLCKVLQRAGVEREAVSTWIMHAGGRDVLAALEKKFGVGKHDFRYSAAMLRDYGNLSSAFVYFVLEAALEDNAPGGAWWLSSFGAGFSCHGALLQVD
ncbi:MAG TPA: 3-oxoacyl-[acyl-carrier-protein] synthase III C-terminal domain-containing protein [Noviherbaspirillum sp.]|jgi:alkylresorcinol/alkylpyrone synthase|uniref:type III polyketide synthase n=1 Tax=Noviherbaspirillum sp. TaxID=1926288 RepID=UPI002DDCFFED|nr:3-oxoacyl-[acyl-carrier-protein] synthase III C-terminal domain-containing protein [Noviherbaspirillum sp.]HEV2612740.1 3-oxoacyl-[acyl-carrier-protein] synthase III C-terminal domain-containing protein [Noviherbaspirillum sp.]